MRFDYRCVDVFVGVDMAKEDHYAQAITTTGEELFHRPILTIRPLPKVDQRCWRSWSGRACDRYAVIASASVTHCRSEL
jgi:hypothetical protein